MQLVNASLITQLQSNNKKQQQKPNKTHGDCDPSGAFLRGTSTVGMKGERDLDDLLLLLLFLLGDLDLERLLELEGDLR